MAGLNVMVNRIYSVLKKALSNVYNEYEKVPVSEHENVYVVCSVPVVRLENRRYSGNTKYYDAYFFSVSCLNSYLDM